MAIQCNEIAQVSLELKMKFKNCTSLNADDLDTLVDLVNSIATCTATGSLPAEQSDWNQTNNTQLSYIKNKPTIPTVQIQSDWVQVDNTQKDFIKNKPSIVQSDMAQINNVSLDYVKNKNRVITVSTSRDYLTTDNDAFIIVDNDITLKFNNTLPSDFSCNVFVKGNFTLINDTTVSTVYAPFGLKLTQDKVQTILRQSNGNFLLIGELSV